MYVSLPHSYAEILFTTLNSVIRKWAFRRSLGVDSHEGGVLMTGLETLLQLLRSWPHEVTVVCYLQFGRGFSQPPNYAGTLK